MSLYVSDAHANEITAVTKALPSLHDLIQKWLERTPFLEDNANLNTTLQGKKMHFWDHYKKAVQNILNNEKAFIRGDRAVHSNSAENFKRPKNREDNSGFHEICQNRSRRLRLSFEKAFRATRAQKQRFQKIFRASRGLNKVP